MPAHSDRTFVLKCAIACYPPPGWPSTPSTGGADVDVDVDVDVVDSNTDDQGIVVER